MTHVCGLYGKSFILFRSSTTTGGSLPLGGDCLYLAQKQARQCLYNKLQLFAKNKQSYLR